MRNIIVGLTGQTGAGKSTVSEYLRANGVTIVDADKVAREVVGQGSACIADIVLEFGCDYLNSDGNLNRKKLAETVFVDKTKLRRLNAVMFPYILDCISERVEQYRSRSNGIIVLDAPTLFESGLDRQCDVVVSVLSATLLRKRRIIARDNLTEEQADARINAQHNDDYYRSRSWFVLNNNTDTNDLQMHTSSLLKRLKDILDTGVDPEAKQPVPLVAAKQSNETV